MSPTRPLPAAATVTVLLNGEALTIAAGSSVAAVLARRSPGTTRVSVGGEPRAAFCGMGICHECRCTIDGKRALACQTSCREAMTIDTERAAPAQGEAHE